MKSVLAFLQGPGAMEKATAGNTEGREFKASYVSLKYKVVGKMECYVYQCMLKEE